MSETHQHIQEHAVGAVTKLAVSAGPTAYGLWTLNDVALAIGILSSLAVLVHTLLNIWWNVRDRRRDAHDA